MRNNLIDSMDQVDISKLTYGDIRHEFGTHRGIEVGTRMEGNRARRIIVGRSGVQTKIGDIRRDIWIQIAKALVVQANDTELYEKLCAHFELYPLAWLRTKTERREYALDLFISGTHNNLSWVGFIRFNRMNRPELLADADIIWIVSECCPIPGEIIRQQYESSRKMYDGRASCPHCGALSTCTQCAPPQNSEDGGEACE